MLVRASRTEGQITVLSRTARSASRHGSPRGSGPRPLAFYLTGCGSAPSPRRRASASSRACAPTGPIPIGGGQTEAGLLWQTGSARLLDFGGEGPPVLVLPSLINRADVLDLLPGRSLLAHLAASGYRPLLLDWGVPRGRELRFTLADHIHGRAAGGAGRRAGGDRPSGRCCSATAWAGCWRPALAAARRTTSPGWPCWPRHGPFDADHRCTGRPPSRLSALIATLGYAPVDLLQAFFAQLDPLGVIRKYARFAELARTTPRRAVRRGRGLAERRRAAGRAGGAGMPARLVRRQPAGPRPVGARRHSRCARSGSTCRPSSRCRTTTGSCPPPRPRRWLRRLPRADAASGPRRAMSAWSSATRPSASCGGRSRTGCGESRLGAADPACQQHRAAAQARPPRRSARCGPSDRPVGCARCLRSGE